MKPPSRSEHLRQWVDAVEHHDPGANDDALGVFDASRRNDAVVYGVIVRSRSKASFLHELSERTGGGIVEIESTKDLANRFVAILDEFRQRYLVSFTPRGVAKGGWHRLDVRVKGRKAAVKARAGYLAGS